jgi:hypothetical protein
MVIPFERFDQQVVGRKPHGPRQLELPPNRSLSDSPDT